MVGTFIIAEAGVNHNGSLDTAIALVDAAAAAGADAVKFQTFRADSVVAQGTTTAEYQKAQTGVTDQHELIRRLELSEEDHFAITARCAAARIEFMSTPFDTWGLELLLRVGVRRMKIASGELTNRSLIERIAALRMPMILSTGMGSLDEVKRAVDWIADAVGGASEAASLLTILHCTSNYPARAEDVNLRAMATMANVLSLPVGYSDHTTGTAISLAAVAMGATVIEKHFTLDKDAPGPDHRASLDVDELTAMVAGIREIERSLGDGVKAPRDAELPVRDVVRRSAFAARDLAAGGVLADDDLTYLRPGTGIGAEHSRALIGRTAVDAIAAGTMLEWSMLR